RGRAAREAEAIAVSRFGGAASVAEEWVRADRCEPPRLCWSLLTALGGAVGMTLGVPAGLAIGEIAGPCLLLPVAGTVIGGTLGLCQWMVLRRHVADTARWICGSGLGTGAGLLAGTWLVESIGLVKYDASHETIALLLVGSTIGFATGGLQWLGIRRRVAASGWWTAGNAAAVAAGLAIGGHLARDGLGGIRTAAGLAATGLAAALLLGLFTALCLGAVIREPPRLATGK
ncbi:MAG: hypothetical protein R3190_13985, partial [Thermoanaerobaculia bacterium]|nr:hypothetical protein [Thermoanaerobaculia bacterium]